MKLITFYKLFRRWGNSRKASVGKALLFLDGQTVFLKPYRKSETPD